ncbi:hypothetical protein I7I48_11264 [Histoplasma ohiense]|nr:hypothetical protein I7I48_11264 [Histoplasma ohiense (nom. inval.)]
MLLNHSPSLTVILYIPLFSCPPVYCPFCYACGHTECAGVRSEPQTDSQIICFDCKNGKLCTELISGDINHIV